MNLSRTLLTLLFAFGSLFACRPTTRATQQPEKGLPSRPELLLKFRQTRKIWIVFQGEDPATTQKWAELLKRAQDQLPSWYAVEIMEAREASDSLLRNNPSLLIGTPAGNPFLAKLNDRLPVPIGEGLFHFADRVFRDSLISLNLNFVPNPLNPGMPINVITGLSEEAITHKLTGPPMTDYSNPLWSSYGYEVSREGERLMVGLFGEDWQYDSKSSWDFTNENQIDIQTAQVAVKAHGFELDEEAKTAIPRLIADRWTSIQGFFDTIAVAKPFVFHLYKDAELMGMQRRKMLQGFCDFQKNEVHQIYHPAVNQQHTEAFNAYLVQSLLGHELPPFLAEGLSHFFAEKWQKQGVLSWALRLNAANALLEEENLWGEEAYEGSSIYVRGATAGGLVHFLAQNHKALLVQACHHPKEAVKLIQPLFQEYKSYLAAQELPASKNKPEVLNFHLGMTFAHEGYNIYNGYASQLGNEALAKVASLNANSVAIVPYSGSRNTDQPVKYRFWEGAGGENSMSVVFAKHHAAGHGMVSLLKPQIYYREGWPGAVKMKNKEDWKLWHQYYKEWITHYALLAAMFDFEYFCIGVEFVNATLENPDSWRQLVRDMRQIYHGPITYATNWGEEAEKIAFADELDFLGVNCYYPLSKKEDPTDEELLQGALAVRTKMEEINKRTSKPIVFTEVGFRPVERAWQNPHDEPNGRNVDNEAQLRCYRALMEAMDGQPWFEGTYWWKWPSYLGYSSTHPHSFTPCGKETEALLREWYQKWGRTR